MGIFKDDELSYSLGKQGTTRKKLEMAAGAILEYVGHVAFIAGTLKERKRCKEFINWLRVGWYSQILMARSHVSRNDHREQASEHLAAVGVRNTLRRRTVIGSE